MLLPRGGLGMGNVLASFQRTGRIAQVLVRHGLRGLGDQLVGQLAANDRSAGERVGRRIALALDELGPTFVKLGQILATREDMVPASIARELAALQDRATPFPARAARAVIRESLGAPVSALFRDFDDTPLAAGSIAQVHRARTRDGHDVVVKVRRPGIDRVIDEDLALVGSLAEIVAARVPEARRYDPIGFAREFGRGLRAELDLGREAIAMVRMQRVLGRAARVPRPYSALTTRDVLTLSFVDGHKVTELADAGARRAAARAIVGSFATQYLRAPLFHADPHAGNLVWTADGLTLLDLGAVGELTPATRAALMRLSIAAARRSGDAMARAVLAMVHAPADLDEPAYRRDMGRVLDELVSRPLGEVRVSVAMREVFALARRHGLRFRSEYFLLFRSSMLVDGVLRTLDPDIDPVAATRGHIIRSWYQPAWLGPAIFLGSLAAFHKLAGTARRVFAWLPKPRIKQLPP